MPKRITAKTLANGIGEVRMYGEITTAKDDWTSSEETITPKKFEDAIASLGDVKTVQIRLSSIGGDAYAGIAIGTALKKLKAKTEVFVEGIVASAGTVIMCSADKVTVSPSSMVMIHGASAYTYGFLNAEDLAKVTQNIEAINKAISNVYVAKTGKDEKELADMMSAETWLVGQEIVDAGFADELTDEGEPITACLIERKGRQILTVNDKIELDISGVHNVPDSIAKAKAKDEDEKPEKDEETEEESSDQEEEKEADAKCKKPKAQATVKSVDVEALVNAGIAAECQRIRDIFAIKDRIKDKNLLMQAMFDPEKKCDAKELAYLQMQAEAKADADLSNSFLKDLEADYRDSNVANVGSACAPEQENSGDAAKTVAVNALMAACKNVR